MKANKVVLLALATSLMACSENMTMPTADLSETPTTVEGSSRDLTAGDTVKFSITIDPSRQTLYNLGAGNTLTFPAGSLCDPNSSSYGDTEWDKPCVAAASPLTVNVMIWLDRWGHARVDFDKHVRFVPSDNPAQWVVITFADLQASLDPSFNILYCLSWNSSCRDESKKDPSLLPVKNPITGKITRRIKHFSGYNVAAGRDGDDTLTDPWWSAESLTSSTTVVSGYILASG